MTHTGRPTFRQFELYIQKAVEENAVLQRKGTESGLAGAAKPIIVFDEDSWQPCWRLRNSEVLRPGHSAWPGSVRRSLLSLEGAHASRTTKIKREDRSSTHAALFDAINGLIDAYRERPAAAQYEQILHALNRLQIYASSVPLNNDDRGLKDFFQFLEETSNNVRADQAGLRRADVAADVLNTLKTFTHYFRERSLSLTDISQKIATKPYTRVGSDALRERLAYLVERGLQTLTPQTDVRDLHQFLSAFFYASRCFFSPAPTAQTNANKTVTYAELVNKAVTHLGRSKIGGVDALFELFKRFHEATLMRVDENFVAAYETLLHHDSFNTYLEQLTRADDIAYLQNAIDKLVRSSSSALWQAGMRLLSRRPIGEFFKLTQGLASAQGTTSGTKINYLFAQLDAGLRPVGDRHSEHRYRSFLHELSGLNRLQLIRAEFIKAANPQLTINNLNRIFRAGIRDVSQLERFFSNGAFRAGIYFDFDGSKLHRLTEGLFEQAGASPVLDDQRFHDGLDILKRDFASGMPNLRGLLLSTLGAGFPPEKAIAGARQKSVPVEAWLHDKIIPYYDRLLRVVMGCYPQTWQPEDFEAHDWFEGKLLMARSGQLLLGRTRDGKPALAELVARDANLIEPEDGTKYFSAQGTDLDQLYLDAERSCAASDNLRRELIALVHNSRAYTHLGYNEAKIAHLDDYLSRLLVTLQLSSPAKGQDKSKADKFQDRINAVATFFGAVAEIKRPILEYEATLRFFRNNTLTPQGRKFVGDKLPGDATDFDALRSAVVSKMFEVGCDVIGKLIEASPDEASLLDGVKKISSAFIRELDYQAFTTELIVGAFNERHCGAIEVSHSDIDELRIRLFQDSQAALKADKIDYIMPNQALAVGLCQRDDLKNENILFEMGTGQGKSVVIAMTALQEARRLEAGQYVFVLTSYDHLAIGDHNRGTKFFKNIRSACLTDLAGINNLDEDTKIIYANAKTLQRIVQQALKNLIQSVANPEKYPPTPAKQLAFLAKVYNNAHRFILDEYDLVLNDLDYSSGTVSSFSQIAIDRDFVRKNGAYAPVIAAWSRPKDTTRAAGGGHDRHSGDAYHTIDAPYTKSGSDTAYHLRAGGLRVSRLLKNARRIIGLSGSTEGDTLNQVLGLEDKHAKYFELPSSRDPSAFRTRLAHSKEELDGLPGIWRAQEDRECSSEDEYIAAIVGDVEKARLPREVPDSNGRYETRPVMIFVDPDNTALVNKVFDALTKLCGTDVNGSDIVQKKLAAEDIKGSRLQEIGFPGKVTLVSALCGRGADIYVSPDVPDSMHVLIATSIPTERLKTQMIGRTGRMGRNGSYSIITLGKLIVPSSRTDHRAAENLLHDFSQDIVNRLASDRGCDRDTVLRWLLLSSEVVWAEDTEDKKNKTAAIERLERHRSEFQ